jgi:polysaccharide export outer membrane protein
MWPFVATLNLLLLSLLVVVTGCQTEEAKFESGPPGAGNSTPASAAPASALSKALAAAPTTPAATNAPKSEGLVLHEGDTVRITFPGASTLDMLEKIRTDGKISLKLMGEFQAAGLTPSVMEKELLRLYDRQLQTKEVTVTVESAAFPVYLSGAVLRPGKILSDRPLTVLEAIMEAGGFDSAKANLKKITVIRHEKGKTEHYKLNLKGVIQGQEDDKFNLKPSDIIFVPERFQWF